MTNEEIKKKLQENPAAEEIKQELQDVINALDDFKEELLSLYEDFDNLTPEEYDNRVVDILFRYAERNVTIL